MPVAVGRALELYLLTHFQPRCSPSSLPQICFLNEGESGIFPDMIVHYLDGFDS